MILLDYQDRRPIYEQVTEKFRILILRGVLKPGDKMPSVRQLAMELSINPNTIQRAYMALEQEGFIYPVKGRGNFVSDSTDIKRLERRTYLEQFQESVLNGKNLGLDKEVLIEQIEHLYQGGETYD